MDKLFTFMIRYKMIRNVIKSVIENYVEFLHMNLKMIKIKGLHLNKQNRLCNSVVRYFFSYLAAG